MKRIAQFCSALTCLLLTAQWLPSPAAGATTVTQTTSNRTATGTTSYSVSSGSLYDPEPALASLLKGQAELGKAAADWVTACAKVVSAQAQTNLANAQAGQALESARTQAVANHVKAATNFYERRKLYEVQREVAGGPRQPGNHAAARAANAAAANAPGGDSVDLLTGQIRWPRALMHGELLDGRVQLETLFAARSRDGTRVSTEVRAAVAQMHQQLRPLVRQMPPSEYAAAKRFLDGLAREAQRTPALAGMAGR